MPRTKKTDTPRKTFPKPEPMGRRAPKKTEFVDVSEGPEEPDNETVAETVPEDKVEVIPPQVEGVITLAINTVKGTTDMDLGGFSIFQAALYLELAANHLKKTITEIHNTNGK